MVNITIPLKSTRRTITSHIRNSLKIKKKKKDQTCDVLNPGLEYGFHAIFMNVLYNLLQCHHRAKIDLEYNPTPPRQTWTSVAYCI